MKDEKTGTGKSIERIKIDHYGPLSDFDVELDEGLNVFHGLNESGKTLLVEAVTSMLVGDNFGRIDGMPEGFMTFTDGGKINASNNGPETVFEDVTAEDVFNAFVIRDSDLRRPERDNSFSSEEYFRDVTDRILGSKTRKIEALIDELKEIGFLTNKLSLENRKKTGKLKDAREDALELEKDIQGFMEELEGEGLYDKLIEINRLEENINEKKEVLEELENARKQDKHVRGLKVLEKLEKAQEKVKSLDREKDEVDELQDLKREAEEFTPSEEVPGKWAKASMLSGTGSAVPAVVSLFSQGIIQLILGIASLLGIAGTIIFIHRYAKASQQEKSRENERESLLEEARASGFDVDSVPEIISAIEDYASVLQEDREEATQRKQELLQKMSAEFSASHQDLEGWRKMLEEFSQSFENVDRDYSEEEFEEEERKLEEMKERKQKLEKDLRKQKRKVKELGNDFERVVDERFLDNPVEVETVDDLSKACEQLREFVDNIDENVEASREAVEILRDMEEEEGDEFNKLFKDSYAVEMFREASNGNYVDINYVRESRELEVERSDGMTVSPDELSQGTYDLLYMCIRLGLAREILDSPGFLILDSAFTHSDVERVAKEIEFLENLEEDGWQIIYLTYREDTKELFQELKDVKELERIPYSD